MNSLIVIMVLIILIYNYRRVKSRRYTENISRSLEDEDRPVHQNYSLDLKMLYLILHYQI